MRRSGVVLSPLCTDASSPSPVEQAENRSLILIEFRLPRTLPDMHPVSRDVVDLSWQPQLPSPQIE